MFARAMQLVASNTVNIVMVWANHGFIPSHVSGKPKKNIIHLVDCSNHQMGLFQPSHGPLFLGKAACLVPKR